VGRREIEKKKKAVILPLCFFLSYFLLKVKDIFYYVSNAVKGKQIGQITKSNGNNLVILSESVN